MRYCGIIEYEGEKWVYDLCTGYVQKLRCYLEGNNCLNCINKIMNNCNIDKAKEYLNSINPESTPVVIPQYFTKQASKLENYKDLEKAYNELVKAYTDTCEKVDELSKLNEQLQKEIYDKDVYIQRLVAEHNELVDKIKDITSDINEEVDNGR